MTSQNRFVTKLICVVVPCVFLFSACFADDFKVMGRQLKLGPGWKDKGYDACNFGGGGKLENASLHLCLDYSWDESRNYGDEPKSVKIKHGLCHGLPYYSFTGSDKMAGIYIVFPSLKFRFFLFALPSDCASLDEVMSKNESIFFQYPEAVKAELEKTRLDILAGFNGAAPKTE